MEYNFQEWMKLRESGRQFSSSARQEIMERVQEMWEEGYEVYDISRELGLEEGVVMDILYDLQQEDRLDREFAA
jgi:hypothetical protein